MITWQTLSCVYNCIIIFPLWLSGMMGRLAMFGIGSFTHKDEIAALTLYSINFHPQYPRASKCLDGMNRCIPGWRASLHSHCGVSGLAHEYSFCFLPTNTRLRQGCIVSFWRSISFLSLASNKENPYQHVHIGPRDMVPRFPNCEFWHDSNVHCISKTQSFSWTPDMTWETCPKYASRLALWRRLSCTDRSFSAHRDQHQEADGV